VLDEVVARLVDDDEFDVVGECSVESAGECEAGVTGSENGDTHTR